MRRICARFLTAVAFAGLLSSPALTAHLSADNGVVPSKARYQGLTDGEWSALMWQAVFAIPVEGGQHPFITGGAFGVGGRMVALSAPIVPAGSPKVTIPVTLPQGTPLNVGIIAVECSVAEDPPFHGDNEAELRACANGLLDLASDLYVEIDGRPVTDPGSYRSETPLFRYGPLPAGNYLGLPPGTQSDALAAGYGLLLAPLSVGEHRITVRASVPDFGIAVDTEFIVNVGAPRGQ